MSCFLKAAELDSSSSHSTTPTPTPRFLADSPDTPTSPQKSSRGCRCREMLPDFLADIPARILARKSVSVSASWNASFTVVVFLCCLLGDAAIVKTHARPTWCDGRCDSKSLTDDIDLRPQRSALTDCSASADTPTDSFHTNLSR